MCLIDLHALLCLAELFISPIMNVLPSAEVYEGEIIEVVCKVVNPPKNVEVFLTRDRRILKQAPVSLSHRFIAKEGDSGELVCKAEWGNVHKETYKTITVKGKDCVTVSCEITYMTLSYLNLSTP